MLDKKICFNLQFVYRSYVKKPMEETRSEKGLKEIAECLFSTDNDGRVHFEYPFIVICLFVGVAANILRRLFNRD